MKRASTILAMAIVATMFATMAIADHQDPTLTFSENPATVGEEVTVSAISKQLVNGVLVDRDATIEQCLLAGTSAPAVICDGTETEDPTGTWTLLTGPDDEKRPAEHTFTPAVAGEYGFRAHGHQLYDTDDLVVEAGSNSEKAAGCQGIERAQSRVPQDRGNAKKALEDVAEKLGC